MMSKEKNLIQTKRISSKNVLVDAPVILHHWKLKQPKFFQMAQKENVDSPIDWEYLSNPDGYELNLN